MQESLGRLQKLGPTPVLSDFRYVLSDFQEHSDYYAK